MSSLTHAEWFDLSQPVSSDYDIPLSLRISPGGLDRLPQIVTTRQQRQFGTESGVLTLTHISMSAHAGTHIDAPLHHVADGASIDALPLASFCGPGVVIDASDRAPGDVLRASDLRSAGPLVRRGDIALIRTGWGRLFGTADYYDHPSLGADAAEWLLASGVRLVGVDTATPDHAPARRSAGQDSPCHRLLLGHGVPVAENLYLEDVAGMRLFIFMFPVRVKGSEAAPCRAVAVNASDEQWPRTSA